MAIHHATKAKADGLGIQLTEDKDGNVRAFYPKRAIEWTAPTAKAALDTLLTKISEAELAEYNAANPPAPLSAREEKAAEQQDPGNPYDDGDHEPGDEVDAEEEPEGDDEADVEDTESKSEEAHVPAEVERNAAGIALDGAIAYREGTVTADCPFDPESDDEDEVARANEWYEAWDEAADEKAEEDEKDGGSVVSERYRAKYAEMGHPNHCGDWLADLLVNLTANKAGTNLELFETICELNGVSLAKYNRTTPGWQGRLRMTGRNLLARRVFEAEQLVLPDALGGVTRAPAEWLAQQRFKKPAPKAA